MHTVLVIMDVSYGRYQIVTLQKEFCVAWRKSLRRVWGFPFQTHGVVLPLLSRCLPVLDVRRNMSAFSSFCSVMYST